MNVCELGGKPVFRTCLFSSEKQSSQNDATFIFSSVRVIAQTYKTSLTTSTFNFCKNMKASYENF